jgi:hypothetical protein
LRPRYIPVGHSVAMIGLSRLGSTSAPVRLGNIIGGAIEETTTIDDRAQAAVNSEWRTAREIYEIIDQGAFVSTAAALVRLADAGRIERRHDPHRNVKVVRYRSQNQTQCAD